MLARSSARRFARPDGGWTARSRAQSTSPGNVDVEKMSAALAAAARGDAAASFAEFKKAQEASVLKRDRRLMYGGLVIASGALFFAVRLSQHARLQEAERAGLREQMYTKIEQSERRRDRLLRALPELAHTAAGLKAEKAATLAEEVQHGSS